MKPDYFSEAAIRLRSATAAARLSQHEVLLILEWLEANEGVQFTRKPEADA